MDTFCCILKTHHAKNHCCSLLTIMKMNKLFCIALLLAVIPASTIAATSKLAVTAVNKLSFARPNQTIELTAAQLASLGEKDLAKIHVRDAAGDELICQAVDTDYDAYHQPDIVIFQADFEPNETKTFTVEAGAEQEFKPEQFKAFGRFARERFDDFAWENDRIAHRTYGKGLETWAGEPLCSSAIDIWSKRTNRMVINEWYLADNYHADAGEGADFYSAGKVVAMAATAFGRRTASGFRATSSTAACWPTAPSACSLNLNTPRLKSTASASRK